MVEDLEPGKRIRTETKNTNLRNESYQIELTQNSNMREDGARCVARNKMFYKGMHVMKPKL